MARPKEKSSTAFDQKCVAASDKLANFQATTLRDDIERLFTDEVLTDLSVDLGSRRLALHRCIIKARNTDLFNFLTSFEREEGNKASVIPNSHSADIENCLRSLYTEDDINETIEKLDTYFRLVSDTEIEQPIIHTTNSSGDNMIDSVRETIHIISENITNTSLDLVKSEVGNAEIVNVDIIDTAQKDNDCQHNGICSSNLIKSNTSLENQARQTNGCRFNTARISEESIQRLQERVFGVKTLLRPCSKLGEDFLRMLLMQESTDCSIEVQGEIFGVHRCILAARSSYFAAMLCGYWRESEEERIVLEGVVPSVLKQTLLYLYGGVTQVDPQCPLGGLIMMADMYGIEGLKEVVAFNLNRDYCHFFHRPCAECISGVPEALALTMMYNMDAMKEKCVRWINKNFAKVWPEKSLATLPQEVLKFTVSSAVKDLALNNVLDVLIDCKRLNEKTPHLKWTEPVFDMITQLSDAAIEFASKNFSAISGNTLKKIDKEGISFNQQPLENIFGMIIQALSPENTCLAYLSLHKWVKSVEVDEEQLLSEEFAGFVNTLFKKCKDHLCLYVHQAANTAEWELLSKDMQQSIMQDANYVCIDTNRGRMARPKLTSMQKKISATSPLSLKEYFDCHFGQVRPPAKTFKSKKDPIPSSKQKESTNWARGKGVQTSTDSRKMEKLSVRTVKKNLKQIDKDTNVNLNTTKKGSKGKALSVEIQCLNDVKKESSNLSLNEEGYIETEEDYFDHELPLLDIQAIGDIELVDLPQGIVFKEENLLPVFHVEFF